MRITILLMAIGLSMFPKVEAQQERPRVDPTRPPEQILRAGEPASEQVRRTPQLRLNSIFYVEGRARAHIDGEFYREGDRIGQWRVKYIGPDVVELERGDERVSLTVFNFQDMTRSKEIE